MAELSELLLLFLADSLQAHGLGLMLAKFSLQGQWACLSRAAAGNDAPVITSAVERQIITVRIFVRQSFGYGGLHQVRGAKLGKKMFRRRPHRIAEFHQSVKSRHDARRQGKGTVGFGRLNIQIHLRIDKESRAPAHFIAQQRDPGPGVIERFDHDVFQLIPQELLDGTFVFFLYLSVIGQQSDCSEAAVRGSLIITRIDAE